MELTLKRQLEQAEFTKTRGGGYDRTEVDDFLDKSVAMAAKVEARLTQVLDENSKLASGDGSVGAPAGPSADEIEAEIERRVAARLAELPAASASGPSEEETAEQVRRTIVMAERTASEAIREAREDAARMVAEATERAEALTAESEARAAALTAETEERAAALRAESEERAATLTAEAEARAAQLQADAEAEAASERQAARNRLALEISALEGSREALRSDVGVLERHVEEQRTQLRSTVGELERLLDDPAGFRLAPTPALLDPELPDLSDDQPPVAEDEPEAVDASEATVDLTEPEPEPAPDEDRFDPTALQVEAPGAPVATSAAPSDADLEAEASVLDLGRAVAAAPIDEPVVPLPEPAVLALDEEPAAADLGPESLAFAEVDHEAPGVHEPVDSGPPTAPVSVVDLGSATDEPPEEDDAFLAELRKAMADDEPLGPRDEPTTSTLGPMFDEDDRRGWRFGKRR